ncbi:hypothetical protein PUN28_005975 [Cardiocondyla obscurior]|uniref:Uncharacterized protein n=1 Tax=Cardiocondyla obscurior TaxID=286306 RepID=A0AAW2G9C6_9HYME
MYFNAVSEYFTLRISEQFNRFLLCLCPVSLPRPSPTTCLSCLYRISESATVRSFFSFFFLISLANWVVLNNRESQIYNVHIRTDATKVGEHILCSVRKEDITNYPFDRIRSVIPAFVICNPLFLRVKARRELITHYVDGKKKKKKTEYTNIFYVAVFFLSFFFFFFSDVLSNALTAAAADSRNCPVTP